MARDGQVQVMEMLNETNEDDNKKVNSVVQLRHMIVMMIQLNPVKWSIVGLCLFWFLLLLKEIYIAAK